MTKTTDYQVVGASTPGGFTLFHDKPGCMAQITTTDVLSVRALTELVHTHSLVCRYH